MKKEKWLPIKGYEELYHISSFGKVKSLSRKREDGRKYREKLLKPNVMNTGYSSVTLYGGGIHWKIALHRLVAWMFIDNPHSKQCVNHKDGNKLNNTVDNLEWCTYSENIKHSFDKLGRVVWNKGNRKKRPKIKCEWCSNMFTPKRNGQRFCSPKCSGMRNGNIKHHLIEQGLVKVEYIKKLS